MAESGLYFTTVTLPEFIQDSSATRCPVIDVQDLGSDDSTPDSALLSRLAESEQCMVDAIGKPKDDKDTQVCS